MEHLKYPIGKFEYGKSYSNDDNQKHLAIIENFPKELIALVNQLNEQQLNTSYRDGGWTAKQIIHHLADSHINAYIRTKLTVTENKPTIKAYNQDAWANLEDGKNADIHISLKLIEGIHQRWVMLLKTLSDTDLQKTYIHPEYMREFKLDELLALYAWHGNQHYAHLKIIQNL